MKDPAGDVDRQEEGNHQDTWKMTEMGHVCGLLLLLRAAEAFVVDEEIQERLGSRTTGEPVPRTNDLVLPVVQLLLVVLAEDVKEQKHDEAETWRRVK
jgi:hypothetical protein